ncbi:hypothetical protein JTE90_015990 [Oedothorax gibbosus]|uniref:Uncharacterized protein n=1 Tax=Oedothorax gibbosus TaxID=931172 RepID=A0AAV6VR99_9ARAC|nr:hypothetical protein JTE90_015990 [Oedothorax gibbosus]
MSGDFLMSWCSFWSGVYPLACPAWETLPVASYRRYRPSGHRCTQASPPRQGKNTEKAIGKVQRVPEGFDLRYHPHQMITSGDFQMSLWLFHNFTSIFPHRTRISSLDLEIRQGHFLFQCVLPSESPLTLPSEASSSDANVRGLPDVLVFVLVWRLPSGLSGLGDPAGIALRVIGAREPHRPDKAGTPR